jgi:hypothetical protein
MKRFVPHVQDRPKTLTPETVVLGLVYAIRDQFYRDDQKQYFHSQLKDLKRVVTYPAKWFNDKAIFVPAERYQEIVLAVLMDIKRHGNTAAIQYWPRYLLTCVQSHFRVQGERYYNEGKAARDLLPRVLKDLPAGTGGRAQAPDAFTRDLATVHALLKSPGGRRKKPAPAEPAAPVQKDLL